MWIVKELGSAEEGACLRLVRGEEKLDGDKNASERLKRYGKLN